ncbi:amidase [Rhizobium mongolense]|uniref:amidase n=1 Tax=Rhizobium mongolense TaxID=57676 RepID=UPI003558BA7B
MTTISKDIQSLYQNSDALDLSDLVKRKEVQPSELMEAAISLAEQFNPRINAIVSTDYDGARVRAAQSENTGLFAGVPYLAKDDTDVGGLRATYGSRFFYRHAQPATDDSEVIRRVRKSGMIPFGLTNAPEIGYASTTEPKLYGPTRNPWNPAYSSGGSSGGAAAAVAARIVPIAGGGDGGGSIRNPASACGLVGLKPSRGRIPTRPKIDSWHGCSVKACVSRTVRDTAAYLDAVSGACLGDPYTPPAPKSSFLDLSSQDPKRLRVGFATSLPCGTSFHAQVTAAIAHSARLLEKLGHDVEPYDFRFDYESAWLSRARISAVEAALLFRRAEERFGATLADDDVEPQTRALIEKGKTIDGVTHAADIDIIRRAGAEIAADLDQFDIFLSPVLSQPTLRLGESPNTVLEDPSKWLRTMAFMSLANMSGLPAISLPVQQAENGLPLGIQLTGRYGDEATLLQAANALEKQVGWDSRRPPILDHIEL